MDVFPSAGESAVFSNIIDHAGWLNAYHGTQPDQVITWENCLWLCPHSARPLRRTNPLYRTRIRAA
jgi:hypothetical protein